MKTLVSMQPGRRTTPHARLEAGPRGAAATPSWIAFAATAVAALALVATPPAAGSEPNAAHVAEEQSPQWGEWTPLGGGLVGRRREPPRLERPLAERRVASVEARLRGRGEAAVGSRQRGSEAARMAGVSGAAAPQALAGSVCARTPVAAAWLRTTAAGLHAVPVADLAGVIGGPVASVRAAARTGRLSLTSAGRDWSWRYDAGSDRVHFVAEPYHTFHTRENAYRAAVGAGRSMGVVRGAAPRTRGIPVPFRDTLRFEEEPDMMFFTWATKDEPDADFWFWDYLYGGSGGRPFIDVGLAVPNPASAGTAEIRVHLQGGSQVFPGDDHQVDAYILLDDQEIWIGSATWDALRPAVLTADVPQVLLNPAGETRLRLRTGTRAAVQFLNWVGVSYLREPVAADGSLWVRQTPAGLQSVSGFASPDILVIESPAGAAVLRQNVRVDAEGGGWGVTFATRAGADYLVVEAGAVAEAALAPDYRSNLRARSNRADYLVITPDELGGTAEALAEYRRGRHAHVEVVCLSDIYDEFSGGREDPTAVARFMTQVAASWQRVPRAVVLVGAGKLDHRDRMGYGGSFLPVVMSDTPWALAPSDERLLAGDGVAPYAIGRLPITSDQEGLAYVEKLMRAELSKPAGVRSAVVAADNPDLGGDFHANADRLAARLTGLGFGSVTKLYHLPRETRVRNALIDSATWQTADYLNYDGHGSVAQLGDNRERFITTTDAGNLQNERAPIFTALSCSVGDDSWPGTRSLAGALVLNPQGGAIAALAPTGNSYDEGAQRLGNAFVDRLFGHGDSIGEAIRAAKAETRGEMDAYMPRIYGVVGDPSVQAP